MTLPEPTTRAAAPMACHDTAVPTPPDIEAIERATLAAVAPQTIGEFAELPGWLLPVDAGTVNRARSAVPLRHDAATWRAQPGSAGSADMACFAGGIAALERIERHYADHRLPANFRLPETPGFDGWRHELTARGYTGSEVVLVQVASVVDMGRVSDLVPAEVARAPDAAWTALFLGPGFDPVDGASRVAALSRARGSAFASVRGSGETLAAGAGAFSHGWASVHGMRTAATHRGQGLAGRVLVALAREAEARGLSRVFLQVEQRNLAAVSLYRRAGFATAWAYRYWQRPR